jgi:pimeloyl-ACP methyl ester carboxylesterase
MNLSTHNMRVPTLIFVCLYVHVSINAYSCVFVHSNRFSLSVFAIEYPGYGPAEGEPSESTVNDNLFTAFNYLLQLGYPPKNIILMGYSIGTGPTIKLASTLCESDMSPGAVVTIAAFLSICDIVRDLRGAMLVSWLAGAIENRWASGDLVNKIDCPILFIHGKMDDVIPYTHSEKLYEQCSSEQKFIRICQDATHTHFHEPVDTIEPISMFIAEMLRPRDANILPPNPVHFLCPQSVADRENGDDYLPDGKGKYFFSAL